MDAAEIAVLDTEIADLSLKIAKISQGKDTTKCDQGEGIIIPEACSHGEAMEIPIYRGENAQPGLVNFIMSIGC